MEGIDPTSPHRQTALATAALAVAFAKTLQEAEPDEEEVLLTLQRNVKIAHTQLCQTSDAGAAAVCDPHHKTLIWVQSPNENPAPQGQRAGLREPLGHGGNERKGAPPQQRPDAPAVPNYSRRQLFAKAAIAASRVGWNLGAAASERQYLASLRNLLANDYAATCLDASFVDVVFARRWNVGWMRGISGSARWGRCHNRFESNGLDH